MMLEFDRELCVHLVHTGVSITLTKQSAITDLHTSVFRINLCGITNAVRVPLVQVVSNLCCNKRQHVFECHAAPVFLSMQRTLTTSLPQ